MVLALFTTYQQKILILEIRSAFEHIWLGSVCLHEVALVEEGEWRSEVLAAAVHVGTPFFIDAVVEVEEGVEVPPFHYSLIHLLFIIDRKLKIRMIVCLS